MHPQARTRPQHVEPRVDSRSQAPRRWYPHYSEQDGCAVRPPQSWQDNPDSHRPAAHALPRRCGHISPPLRTLCTCFSLSLVPIPGASRQTPARRVCFQSWCVRSLSAGPSVQRAPVLLVAQGWPVHTLQQVTRCPSGGAPGPSSRREACGSESAVLGKDCTIWRRLPVAERG